MNPLHVFIKLAMLLGVYIAVVSLLAMYYPDVLFHGIFPFIAGWYIGGIIYKVATYDTNRSS